MDEIHRKEPAKYAIFLQGKLQMYLNTKLAAKKVEEVCNKGPSDPSQACTTCGFSKFSQNFILKTRMLCFSRHSRQKMP